MELQDTISLEMDDEAAMGRVKNGEVKELDVLFRRHSGALFGFFYGMCRNAALSEDLVQEVFWRILRFRETFDETCSFKAWIYRISRNLYIDRVRREKKRTEIPIEYIGEQEDDTVPTGYDAAVHLDDRKRLSAALDALPHEQREILVLARYKGLTFKAIGEILGCSEGTAKVRAFRALQALRTIYFSNSGSDHK